MKMFFTRFVVLALTLAMLGSMVVPASAASNATESSSDYIEVTSKEAPLRSGPGKNHSEIATLHDGDCLIVSGYTINKHGNLWYEVEYGDSIAYLYEPHAAIHQHNYNPVADGLNICKCGAYTIDEGSAMRQMGDAAATAGTIFTAEAVSAVVKLSAAGTAIFTGVTAAFPYIVVVVVSGVLISMALNTTGTQVKNVTKIKSIDDVKKLMDDNDGIGAYFAAVFAFGEVPALILASEGMDLDEATNYLRKCVRDPLSAVIYDVTGKPMVNIYTFTDDLAKKLCQNFIDKEKSYAFGDSNKSLSCPEHDRTYKNYKIYFKHYHIYYVDGPFSLIKNREIHILFGNPLDKGAIA